MELCHGSDVGKPNPGGSVVLWGGGKGSSVTPGAVSSSSWLLCRGCRSGWKRWLFPAHPNFSQLKALATIHFAPVCKDFMSAFSSHRFQLWFGVCFILLLSILSCAGGNSQLDAEAVKFVGWEFSSATCQGLALPFPLVLGWGRIWWLSPPVYLLGRLGKLGQGWDSSWVPGSCSCPQLQLLSECPELPVLPSGCPPRDGNRPALLILNTRRCKSHLTFSFRNCDLFSELLASVRDRNPLPSWVLLQFTAFGKVWGALSCFCWGVKRRNSLRVIVKLKVQKVFF